MFEESRTAGSRGVGLGEFPYPLTRGPRESRYLTWLRNHSDYMASGGTLDYLRMAGVLTRGILLNFLILLSLLLFVAAIVGHLYGPQLRAMPSLADLRSPVLDEGLVSRLRMPAEERALPRASAAAGRQADEADTGAYVRAPEQDKLTGWLANRLSDRTKAALNATEPQPGELNAALLEDLRRIIGGELIVADDEGSLILKPVLKQDTRRALEPQTGFWPKTLEALSLTSRSRTRQLNRQILEDAYPGLWPLPREEAEFALKAVGAALNFRRIVPGSSTNEELEAPVSAAGRWYESGVLPPMPVPYTLTRTALMLALLLILLSPLGVLFHEIAGHRQSSQKAGSDSSVKLRDRFERAFGSALLVILSLLCFETLPILVDRFHQFRVSPNTNWNTVFGTMAAVSFAVVGGSNKLLSVLDGAKRTLMMWLIGLLGVAAPMLVVLYATEFIVYTDPYLSFHENLLLVVLPILLVLGIGAVMVVGYTRKSFERSEYVKLCQLAAGVGLGAVALGWFVYAQVFPDSGANYLDQSWNHYFVLILAVEIFVFCRLIVDINRTSVHGLYRDRLASAYLVGVDNAGDVDIEEDINLGETGCHEAGSTAPYHLVNVALNLQGSRDMSIRDRKSDFFVFSKRFVGGDRTGYCRTETLERVHPQMSLATAMAISAAAASPNMGRGTNPLMVSFMVLLNIRLGYWLPNPGRLEEELNGSKAKEPEAPRVPPGLSFEDVFAQELTEIDRRWTNTYRDPAVRRQADLEPTNRMPTTKRALVGLGFSGGGIRSATINLGIAQVLHDRGIFDHVDYMSTVSGGGYLGSSLTTLMRTRTRLRSEIDGKVTVATGGEGEKIVKVTSGAEQEREYRYASRAHLAVQDGDTIREGQLLIHAGRGEEPATPRRLWDRFRWRVRPSSLVREMLMKLDERHKWVNLSDGGHIENLAGIELLRRRCKYVILGDGEADPFLTFNGMATLIRYARIDLGTTIDLKPDAIRIRRFQDAIEEGTANLSTDHWAFGTITYPRDEERGLEQETGYLIYLKSSFSGDEDEVIQEYRHRNPTFPHESTADQSFDENQFESYRALGQHIAEKALEGMHIKDPDPADPLTFEEFEQCVADLATNGVVYARPRPAQPTADARSRAESLTPSE